ncbi:dihydrolipoamide acetyltransferase [Buchnera aphidicola (Muscaphis stroyani)]|uniref:Dihydrolipoamide acetyltransferase component of pyruvate dehydrogenase complex n=1 Tax=Buchnera aphidicola (Muscaphis stroyani) TaxID=1241869 RepID=A0A4D6YEQ2_9GAMM|nr:2-oxo acid dehydrogenase subunit E2 [Buchnera aphidicola]QCI24294.1 dihydrolipoamide acetyltransferase [Buchnera aphidicola (Muscaphis stroyani)]
MDIEVKVPDIGLDEAEVTEILVTIGQKIELEQGLITIEGDKSSIEIPSPFSGIVHNINVKIGDKVRTSSIIMILKTNVIHDTKKEENFQKIKKTNLLNNNNIDIDVNRKIKNKNLFHATPVIRRLARNLNIDLNKINGSGRKNRILKEDIILYKKNNFSELGKYNISIESYSNSNHIENEKIKLTSIQKLVGHNLYQNWINVPHVTHFDEANVTILEAFRKKYNNEKKEEKHGNNITMLVFIIKVVSYALEKFPIFNSSLSLDKESIIFKKYINIGVAISIKNGLVVPVLRDVNKKNITQLSNELILMSKKAREEKLSSSDMKKGCFTISNLGSIGGSWFSPIVNSPEVAILGVSKSTIKPFWDGKNFVPSLMLPLSLSYDHRVINGADAAYFMTFIRKVLSDIHFLIM